MKATRRSGSRSGPAGERGEGDLREGEGGFGEIFGRLYQNPVEERIFTGYNYSLRRDAAL